MVLSPDEMQKRVKEIITTHVDALETKIDEALVNACFACEMTEPFKYFIPGGYLPPNMQEGLSITVQQRVLADYAQRGWNINSGKDKNRVYILFSKQ